MTTYCDDGDHFFNAVYCDICGKYQGMACEYCGTWNDGWDYMVAQPELWCTCGTAVSTQTAHIAAGRQAARKRQPPSRARG